MIRDEVELQRIFENVEWLLDGNVPVDEAVRRAGWSLSIEALAKSFRTHGRPVPPTIQAESSWEKQCKQVNG